MKASVLLATSLTLLPMTTLAQAPTAKLLKDVHTGSTKSSSPKSVVRFGKYVFFSANDGKNGTETWISDGTSSGTTLLTDLHPEQPGPEGCAADLPDPEIRLQQSRWYPRTQQQATLGYRQVGSL